MQIGLIGRVLLGMMAVLSITANAVAAAPFYLPMPAGNVTATNVFVGALVSDYPTSIKFDASGSVGYKSPTITSYSWNFGDGKTATGPIVSNDYTAKGSYVAMLTVSDSSGGVRRTFSQVLILTNTPVATYMITATAGAGGTISPAGAVSVAQGASPTFGIAANSGYQIADVKVDGVSQGAISSYPFTSVQTNHTINATFSAVVTKPSITTQPANKTVTAGQTATFSVTASGTAPLSYQWRKAGAGISGATAASYTTAATTASDNGSQFSVVVANSAGSVTSSVATLTVTATNKAPTVATAAAASPNPVTGTTGALSVLGADDAGEAALTYMWTTTGTPPAPVTFSANSNNAAKSCTATFTKAGSYSLQVTIRDAAGLTALSSVAVTVNQTLTTVTVAPATASVNTGATQQFTASGKDQFGVVLASQPAYTWTVTGGGTISAGGLFTAGSTNGGPYTVTATSGGKSGTAGVSVVAVVTKPSITTQPASQTVTAGQTATFSVTASGTAPLSYQWRKAGAGISGATAASYTTAATTASDNGSQFSVVVANSAGSVTSSVATLTVTAPSGNETVWVDDALPAGAASAGSWPWVSSSPAPYSGSLAHSDGVGAGVHQHYFTGATLAVGTGDKLFTYVYLDPANKPTEVMLQWNNGSWEHRAYWGANNINWGMDGTVSRRYMGALPSAGEWVRLEVAASAVGLEGSSVNGMAFTLCDGRATFDRTGRTTAGTNAAPTVATAAAATPNPVTATTTTLSVLGADDAGESALAYMWVATGTPPAPVSFSANSNNTAKSCAVTFTKAGSYSFLVTIRDAAGLTASSSVSVTVNQTIASVAVSPASVSVAAGGTQQFTASAVDQFGQAMSAAYTWTVSGGGSINSSGLFTAGATAGGPYTVTASSNGKSGTAGVTVTAPAGIETVWVEDSLPAGAAALADGGDSWTWVSASPVPYSGSLTHQSAVISGQHQHYFTGATAGLAVGTGDKLFAYVYLDPANMPSEVMLQWNDGGWEHRAYWGANSVNWGVDGTVSRRYMGALPGGGQWVRLEVAASLVGLEGRTITGMAFTLYGGRATWDRAGKLGSVQSTPGLKGEYFDNMDLTGLKLTRTDATVDFSWGSGSPDPAIGADTFSVRWTGQVQAQFSETYTFYTLSDDGVRLWVNGQQLVNNWTDHSATENSGTITLVAGQKYDIRMEYYENGAGSTAQLLWSSPSTAKQVIPTTRLFSAGVVATGVGGGGAAPAPVGVASIPQSVDVLVNGLACEGEGGYRIKIEGVQGGKYVVEYRDGLTDANGWRELMTGECMVDGPVEFVDNDNAASRFYRVRNIK